jgi:RES domain-containing protein
VVTAWRIVKAKYVTTAWDGEGARIHGGRWNSPGLPMVYTADSPALAALEMLTALHDAGFLASYVLISIKFPEAAVTDVVRTQLPAEWHSFPAPPELQRIGDAWLKSNASAALRVPSEVTPQQFNYPLNPKHASFARFATGTPQPFQFDERLLRRK